MKHFTDAVNALTHSHYDMRVILNSFGEMYSSTPRDITLRFFDGRTITLPNFAKMQADFNAALAVDTTVARLNNNDQQGFFRLQEGSFRVQNGVSGFDVLLSDAILGFSAIHRDNQPYTYLLRAWNDTFNFTVSNGHIYMSNRKDAARRDTQDFGLREFRDANGVVTGHGLDPSLVSVSAGDYKVSIQDHLIQGYSWNGSRFLNWGLDRRHVWGSEETAGDNLSPEIVSWGINSNKVRGVGWELNRNGVSGAGWSVNNDGVSIGGETVLGQSAHTTKEVSITAPPADEIIWVNIAQGNAPEGINDTPHSGIFRVYVRRSAWGLHSDITFMATNIFGSESGVGSGGMHFGLLSVKHLGNRQIISYLRMRATEHRDCGEFMRRCWIDVGFDPSIFEENQEKALHMVVQGSMLQYLTVKTVPEQVVQNIHNQFQKIDGVPPIYLVEGAIPAPLFPAPTTQTNTSEYMAIKISANNPWDHSYGMSFQIPGDFRSVFQRETVSIDNISTGLSSQLNTAGNWQIVTSDYSTSMTIRVVIPFRLQNPNEYSLIFRNGNYDIFHVEGQFSTNSLLEFTISTANLIGWTSTNRNAFARAFLQQVFIDFWWIIGL